MQTPDENEPSDSDAESELDPLDQDRDFMAGPDDDEDEVISVQAEVKRQIRSPHEGKVANGRRPRPNGPLATFGGDSSEYDRWLVEYEDTDSGRNIRCGTMHPDATPREFVKKIIHLIPPDGELVTFHLTPLDARGTKLNGGKPYTTVSYSSDSFEVRELKAADPTVFDPTGFGVDPLFPGLHSRGDSGMAAMYAAQLQAQSAREEVAREEARELRETLARLQSTAAAEQATASQTVAADMSVAYGRILETSAKAAEDAVKSTSTGLSELMRYQQQLATEREQREIAERNRIRDEAKAEIALAQLKMQTDAELRKEEMRIAADIRKAELAAQIAREEAARVREEQRRADERREEAQRRADEREADNKRREDERNAARDHAKAMETIRTDAAAAAERRDDAERKRQSEHFQVIVSTLKERGESAQAASPMGAISSVLDFLGLTPVTAMEKAKELFEQMSGGSAQGGIIVEGIRAITTLGEKWIEANAGAEGDEDDEEEEEEEPEPEPEPAPRRRAPKVDADAPQPDPKPVRRSNLGQPRMLPEHPPGASLVPLKAPELVPVQAEAAPTAQPVVQTALAPVLSTLELRAGKEGVERVVAAIADQPPEQWPAMLATVIQDGAFLTYLGKVGFASAFEGEADDATLTALYKTLRDMGAVR